MVIARSEKGNIVNLERGKDEEGDLGDLRRWGDGEVDVGGVEWRVEYVRVSLSGLLGRGRLERRVWKGESVKPQAKRAVSVDSL